MELEKILNNYLSNRKSMIEYRKISTSGIKLHRKIRNLEKLRILKPSEAKINETIVLSKKLKGYLINYTDKLKANGVKVISNKEIEDLNNFEINQLEDCKFIASKLFEIGSELEREHSNILNMLMVGNLNFLEFVSFIILMIIAIMFLKTL